jgi:phosphohistidine phosphatase SixA
MKLLLMRHSDRDKESGLPEADQPLTLAGLDKAMAAAEGIRERLPENEQVTGIISSQAKHSLETADKVAQVLGVHSRIQSTSFIASNADVTRLLDLLRQRVSNEVLLVVGHQPQLGALIKALTSEQLPIHRGGVCCLLADSGLQRGTLLWRFNAGLSRTEEPMKYDMKFFTGVFFFLMDLLAFVVGIWLLWAGLRLLGGGGGEGKISIVVNQIGQMTGVNGTIVVFVAGLALVLAAVGYARKAYQEARAFEGGLPDTIRHFSPL